MAPTGRARAAFAGAGLVALIALAPAAALAQTATQPGTPTVLGNQPSGEEYMITLTWNPPSGSTPSAYRIFRCQGAACSITAESTFVLTSTAGGSGQQTFVHINRIDASTVYRYAVQSVNASFQSVGMISAASADLTTPALAPSAPAVNRAAFTVTLREVTLAWLVPDNNRPISGYTLTRTEAGSDTTIPIPGDRTLQEYVDADVMPNTTYSYTLTASNATGTSPLSNTVSVTTQAIAFTAADLHNAILPQVARAMTDSVAAAISGRIRQAADGAGRTGPAFRLGGAETLHDALATTAGPAFRPSGNETLHDALAATAGPAFSLGDNEMRYDALTAHAPGVASSALDLSRLLNGSSFLLPLNAADNGAGNPAAMTFWGRGGYRNLEGGDGLNWDGGLASASIGLDGRPRPDVLLGVALAYSDGVFDYNNADTTGTYDISMTSVHPYLGWSLGRLDLWATAGYGEGEIEITPQGETASSVDADLRSVALGASGQLLSAEGWLNMPGATAVRLKSEASVTRIDVDGDATEAAALSVDATRFRLTLEGTNERTLASGATVSPSLELGVRYDGGDGDSGAGLELGGGVRYTNPATGLSVEGKARVLVGRDDYDEWGVSGTVRLARGADGQGLSFSLSPGYGGIQRLWRNGLPEDGDDNAAAADYRARLEARLGYGFSFALNGHDGMLTPYSELTLGATNRYRVGMNWKAGTRFDLTLLGERREPSAAPAEHAILLKGTVRF